MGRNHRIHFFKAFYSFFLSPPLSSSLFILFLSFFHLSVSLEMKLKRRITQRERDWKKTSKVGGKNSREKKTKREKSEEKFTKEERRREKRKRLFCCQYNDYHLQSFSLFLFSPSSFFFIFVYHPQKGINVLSVFINTSLVSCSELLRLKNILRFYDFRNRIFLEIRNNRKNSRIKKLMTSRKIPGIFLEISFSLSSIIF